MEDAHNAVRFCARTRQARLLMVGCIRLWAGQFFDPRIGLVVGAAERCADDPRAEGAARLRWDEIVTCARPRVPDAGTEEEVARAVSAAWELVQEQGSDFFNGEGYSSPRAALAHAALMCLRDHPLSVFTGGDGNAVDYCLRALARADSLWAGADVTSAVRADGAAERIGRVVGDVFGQPDDRIFENPFRPPQFSPSWRTSTVVALAAQMYETRDFAAMPILGDALQDGGCDNDDVLNHCRELGVHVRGCWVVDLVLGKE